MPSKISSDPPTADPLRCRRCGRPLSTGLVASGRRACCLNATPIAGACPEHGPVGPHDAVEAPPDGSGTDR
ncbi:hypothetical protein [Halobaculum sp. EA56]|uniref:hypothetical protein n=1 Tax=Halobaculum sp. EA56 TaxID=3421648 RepID=UPI003EB8C7C4